MNTIRVHRWISKKEKISYTFGHESDNVDIPIIILQDDSLEKALTKIAIGIYYYHKFRKETLPSIDAIPYIWSTKRSLRFEFAEKDNIKLPVNPWDLNLSDIETYKIYTQNAKIIYNQDVLFMKSNINIVFINDLPNILKPYYFPDAKITWNPNYTLKEFMIESQSLYNLWNIIKNDPDEQRSFIFSKIRFIGTAKLKETLYSPLSSTFENMHTSSQFPFIQYIEDQSRILYKLWKNHSISSQILHNWTFYDRLPKVEMIIVMIPLEREHTFARATLDSNYNISIQYQIDSRDKVPWDIIEIYTTRIKRWFEQILLTTISLQVDSISGKGEFASQGIVINDISKNIGKSIFIPLYHVIKVQDGIVHVAFKRSKNYHNIIDISDYISSNIKLGIPLQEIAHDLIELGMSQKDVVLWIEQYQTQIQTEADLPKKKSLSFTGCILKIDKSPYGFRVIMENVATLEELKFIYHWLRSTFKYIMQDTISKKVQPKKEEQVAPKKEQVAPRKEEPALKKEEPAPKKEEPEEGEDAEEDIFGQELDLEGGAGKKGQGTDRYFLSQLQQNDPAIFLDTKNYARLCAANNFRQPIVVTKQEKDKFDKDGYNIAYDDNIYYGSDTQHMNYYMCPRIWCPTSRIPLTEKQLEDNKGKCPGPHFEKPMKLYENKYWDNNPNVKHHIGFHKQKTPTGLCLPCCMKNPLKEKEIAECKIPTDSATVTDKTKKTVKESKKTEVEQSIKEDGYIMGAVAPLPVDRYGALPQDLHTFLQPNIPYQLCSKTISSTECYLRHGIQHYEDSLMNSIANALNIPSKKEFIKFIIKNLDPLTYISTANGQILFAFIDDKPLILNENKTLIKQWLEWLKIHKTYANKINIQTNSINEINSNILSRELTIYKSYINFINYLQSNDDKNPEHLQEILLAMNIILLIWKRQDNVATLQCLTYTNVNDIFNSALNKKIIMILEDNKYYEPIELKQRGKTSISMFDDNGKLSNTIKTVLNKCPIPYKNDSNTYSRERTFIENIRTLIAWCKLRLFSSSPFIIQSIILRQDFTIYGFITKSNLLIRGPQEGLLTHILTELFNIIPTLKNIIYFEDIANTKLTIHEMFKNDFILFYNKLQDLGLTLNSGTILTDNESLQRAEEILEGELLIEPLNMSILPFIRTHINNEIYNNTIHINNNNKKWYQLQHLIGNTLLKNYETLVEPLLSIGRKERVRLLINTFRKIPDKSKIQTILEEIPIEYGKNALIHWIRSIGLEKRSRIYTSSFIQNDKNKKEWFFSQAAVEYGLPNDILKPVYSIHPNESFTNNRLIEYQANEETITDEPSIPLPSMLQQETNTLQTLPSKWNQIKNYSWNKYSWYKLSIYTRDSIPQLFEWISLNINIPCIWNEIIAIRNKMIIGFLQNKDKEILLKLLEDPSFFKVWVHALKRKFKDANELWKNKLNVLTIRERVSTWGEIVKNYSNMIWPMDLDLKIVATMMNISILIIYRGKYGEGVGTEKRGNVEDLFISSTFYHGIEKDWKKRPCIMFYRSIDKEKVVFSPIIHTNTTNVFIHKTVDNMPQDIQQLLEYHVEKENESKSKSSSSSSSS